MSTSNRLRLITDLQLPDVWRGGDLAAPAGVVPSGHGLLDRQLPGGGWPLGQLVELLQEAPGRHAWQLLLPALVAAIANSAGPVVLVGAPFEPFGPSLAAQGLAADRLLRIDAVRPKGLLWACEQALRCADVAAVVGWLPQAKGPELRRLQLAAQQHVRLLFVFRSLRARQESSPAGLRMLLEGTDALEVSLLKRKGPPLLHPLRLPAHPPRLDALLASRKGRVGAAPPPLRKDRSHVLDRTVSLA